MSEFLTAALLGLGAGAIYGLIAQGVIIIARGSAVLNLAQGAFAIAGAYIFYELRDRLGLPGLAALLGATLATALLGLVCYLVVFSRLRRRSPLTRLIGSLGVLITLQAIATLRYGDDSKLIASVLPSGTWKVLPGTFIGQDRILLLVTGAAITTALWWLYRSTGFGRATAAVAQDGEMALALGLSPHVVGSLNWMLGAAVAGVSGALIAPITGLHVDAISGLIVPALAAALISGFSSFPVGFAAGVGIGVVESEIRNYVAYPGWGRTVSLLAVVLLLLVRGTSLPGRGDGAWKMPRVSSGKGRAVPTIVFMAIVLLLVNNLSKSWTLPIMVTAVLAILGLSVTVVTGLAGQLNLAIFALAGIGALVAAHLFISWHWPFLVTLVGGAIVAGLVGAVVGIPALRTRGPSLAIITLGLGALVEGMVFANTSLTGGLGGLALPSRNIFGWNIDNLRHPNRYATVVVVCLGLLLLMTQNLRRSDTGRRLLAVRANERAATATGINVAGAKIYAFALSAALAGVGGTLMAFQYNTVLVGSGSFAFFSSVTIVGFVVMGSIGYPSGAVVGVSLASGAIVARIVSQWITFDRQAALVGGIGVLLTVMFNPDGIVAELSRTFERLTGRLVRPTHRPSTAPNGSVDVRPAKVDPKKMTVTGLSVSYGGVHAVRNVSFDVAPGEIVGLIGPNGAGKTTIIDAITGLARSSGEVVVGDRVLSKLAPSKRVHAGVARSFQSVELFDDLTVLENLCTGGRSRRWRGLLDLVAPRPAKLSAAAALAVEEFDLGGTLADVPVALTFGRRRLVGIARAVASSPSVLLLDEPGAGLDAFEVGELSTLIRRLAADWGMAIVLVEHHLDMVAAVCDRLVVLESGTVLVSGKTSEVMSNPAVIAAYTGADPSAAEVPRAAVGVKSFPVVEGTAVPTLEGTSL